MSGELDLGRLSQVSGCYRVALHLGIMVNRVDVNLAFFHPRHIRGRTSVNTHLKERGGGGNQ